MPVSEHVDSRNKEEVQKSFLLNQYVKDSSVDTDLRDGQLTVSKLENLKDVMSDLENVSKFYVR